MKTWIIAKLIAWLGLDDQEEVILQLRADLATLTTRVASLENQERFQVREHRSRPMPRTWSSVKGIIQQGEPTQHANR